MSTSLLLVIVLVLLLAGVGPWYPYSRSWGYGPVGLLAVILILFLAFGGLGSFR